MSPWVEKYRPSKFEEVKGQSEALTQVMDFIKDPKRKKKAVLLHGPPGVGKTTIAQVVAKETRAEIFELNASDLRNKTKLQEILKPAMEQQSLTNSKKIILVDEVDGINAKDYGGLPELLRIIQTAPYPIIITANDVWSRNLSTLRQKCILVQLKEVVPSEIKDVLFTILRRENLFINNNIVSSIAVRAKGDIRAAINDLQSIARLQDPSLLTIDERNKEVDIFSALKKIFQEKPTNETLGIFDSVNMPIDEIILWIEENIPKDYSGKELAKAYDALSLTDVFRGRIYKQQYWRFLVYENIFLSYGISASKKGTKDKFTSYKKPSRILKIWLNNQRTIKKKTICQKYARYVHVGQKRAMGEFPVLKQIINSNPAIARELHLTEEELEYLGK